MKYLYLFVSLSPLFSLFITPLFCVCVDCTCSVFKRFRELNYCQMETKIAVMLEIWETLWLMTRVLLKDH